MATYAIGDVQGCYKQLCCLLEKIQFNPASDKLWFTGDLVNRGPESLETLLFIKSLGQCATVVLGNHDLHLLAIAYGIKKPGNGDTLDKVLESPERDELINWLRHQPLLHHDSEMGFALVHAGIAPQWDLATAQVLAKEVEAVLQCDGIADFLQHMYGNKPRAWNNKLTNWKRLRFITNCFTRMRFCDQEGGLDFTNKGGLNSVDGEYVPWFKHKARCTKEVNIIFGHWAAMQGKANTKHIYALDTGCIWGGSLRSMCLETFEIIDCNCK